jgi:hypothetical protein
MQTEFHIVTTEIITGIAGDFATIKTPIRSAAVLRVEGDQNWGYSTKFELGLWVKRTTGSEHRKVDTRVGMGLSI